MLCDVGFWLGWVVLVCRSYVCVLGKGTCEYQKMKQEFYDWRIMKLLGKKDMIYDKGDIRCLVYGILYVYCDT